MKKLLFFLLIIILSVIIFLHYEGWLSSKRETEENGKNLENEVIEVSSLNSDENVFIG